ncbi:MAG: hypothetical protein DRR06_04930 [Gammaproteobacteria bacterium]|nr:MAG: hypothetical protein DRR06_04930 [Gammaproteobacteria bacterium]
MKTHYKRNIFASVLFAAVAFSATAQAEKVYVPSPTSVEQVPDAAPASGNTMTKEYVHAIGQMAYVWGWPLVNMSNRAAMFSKVKEPSVYGGLPMGYNGLAMLTGYISPEQKSVACPNQDVVYGTGFFDLDKEPVILQVPDFKDRFWVYAAYGARTSEFSRIGKPYGTRPGFYMIVGPNWNGKTPAGIKAVLKSDTALIFVIPRIFMDSTAEDKKAIQPVLAQIGVYQLSKFDGKMKTTDWSKTPIITPKSSGKGETQWVNPETFFDELPGVMKSVPSLPGEEALYGWISSVLDAADKDPKVKQWLIESAKATEKEMLPPFRQWVHNGSSAGNGWNSQVNNAAWGTDYLNRTASAKSNMWENAPNETKYIYRDFDSKGQPLDGHNSYTLTFPKGQTPPVKGFWSITLYNEQHFFNQNPLKRYSLGTKNKTLKKNADGSLTLYFGAKSPGKDKESNWLPAPDGVFSLYLRTYWPEKSILDGSWMPPNVEKAR